MINPMHPSWINAFLSWQLSEGSHGNAYDNVNVFVSGIHLSHHNHNHLSSGLPFATLNSSRSLYAPLCVYLPDETTTIRSATLQQSLFSSSTNDYTLQFHTLLATSGWNEVALLSAYQQGLDLRIRAQIAIFDNCVGSESFMQKANWISQHLLACHTSEYAHQSVSPATSPPVPEHMQVDSTRLSRE